MGFLLGTDAKLYCKAQKVSLGGAYTEITNVMNLDVAGDHVMADVTTRGSGGVKTEVPTIKELTLTFQMIYDPEDDPAVLLFERAWVEKSLLGTRCESGTHGDDDARGFQANMAVKKFAPSEPVDGAQTRDVEMVITYPSEFEWIGSFS